MVIGGGALTAIINYGVLGSGLYEGERGSHRQLYCGEKGRNHCPGDWDVVNRSSLWLASTLRLAGYTFLFLDGGERGSVRATTLEGGHTATGGGIGSGGSTRHPQGKRRERRTGPSCIRPLGGGPIRGPRRAIDATHW